MRCDRLEGDLAAAPFGVEARSNRDRLDECALPRPVVTDEHRDRLSKGQGQPAHRGELERIAVSGRIGF